LSAAINYRDWLPVLLNSLLVIATVASATAAILQARFAQKLNDLQLKIDAQSNRIEVFPKIASAVRDNISQLVLSIGNMSTIGVWLDGVDFSVSDAKIENRKPLPDVTFRVLLWRVLGPYDSLTEAFGHTLNRALDGPPGFYSCTLVGTLRFRANGEDRTVPVGPVSFQMAGNYPNGPISPQ
jgi:hypothetical protein